MQQLRVLSSSAIAAYSGDKVVHQLNQIKPLSQWPTTRWLTASPEEQGIDSAGIAAAVDACGSRNLHSFVLVRNGCLVAEGYSQAWDEDKLHPVYSIAKSFTSAVAGMAIDMGLLEGVDQRAGDFFPELAAKDVRKSEITIAQLLSMSSGLAWNNRGEQSSIEMADAPDWLGYVLERPMAEAPGTVFRYCNGNAHWMSGLLQQAIGIPVALYAEHKLLRPLGVRSFGWGADPQGITIGSWALYLTARDMAKFGLLYLQGGLWEGEELVSRSWVEASVQLRQRPVFRDGTQGGYGFNWWLKPISNDIPALVFYAAGSGGQRIFVVPEWNLVLTTTGNNQRDDYMPERLLAHMAAAVKSERALPENKKAAAKLSNALASFNKEVDKPELCSL